MGFGKAAQATRALKNSLVCIDSQLAVALQLSLKGVSQAFKESCHAHKSL